MKKYERVTPIGLNTGKVIIGCAYLPKLAEMDDDAVFIQSILLNKPLRFGVIRAAIEFSHVVIGLPLTEGLKLNLARFKRFSISIKKTVYGLYR